MSNCCQKGSIHYVYFYSPLKSGSLLYVWFWANNVFQCWILFNHCLNLWSYYPGGRRTSLPKNKNFHTEIITLLSPTYISTHFSTFRILFFCVSFLAVSIYLAKQIFEVGGHYPRYLTACQDPYEVIISEELSAEVDKLWENKS